MSDVTFQELRCHIEDLMRVLIALQKALEGGQNGLPTINIDS